MLKSEMRMTELLFSRLALVIEAVTVGAFIGLQVPWTIAFI